MRRQRRWAGPHQADLDHYTAVMDHLSIVAAPVVDTPGLLAAIRDEI
ncbi:hypothetical protein [Sphaerisporangium perillae]|nr:hypothetical protein [Sphaerisporangium perillae]